MVNKWARLNESYWPATNCTALVPIETNYTLGNTLGLPRLSKFIRDITYINFFVLALLIGVMLGDGHLRRWNTSARFVFKQSIINFHFFWDVFIHLIHYVASMPSGGKQMLNGKAYYNTTLNTRSYPVFLFLYDLFYLNGVKIVSPEIFHFFTPVSLAYWIMSDGVSSRYGLTLCTDSFTIQKIVLLINILIIKYDLNCTIHKSNKNYRIYIKADSMAKLHKIVDPFILPLSAYKLRKGARYAK